VGSTQRGAAHLVRRLHMRLHGIEVADRGVGVIFVELGLVRFPWDGLRAVRLKIDRIFRFSLRELADFSRAGRVTARFAPSPSGGRTAGSNTRSAQRQNRGLAPRS
jgi:hypothetical protein